MSVTYIQLTAAELQAVAENAAAIALQKAARVTGEVWSHKEMAQHYNVCERTITNWERIGRIPARVNGYWRKADVLAAA